MNTYSAICLQIAQVKHVQILTVARDQQQSFIFKLELLDRVDAANVAGLSGSFGIRCWANLRLVTVTFEFASAEVHENY